MHVISKWCLMNYSSFLLSFKKLTYDVVIQLSYCGTARMASDYKLFYNKVTLLWFPPVAKLEITMVREKLRITPSLVLLSVLKREYKYVPFV